MSHAEQEMHPVVSSLTFWQRMMCRWADRIAVGRLTLQFEGYGEHVAIGWNHTTWCASSWNTMRASSPSG